MTHPKASETKVRCSHIPVSIYIFILGRLQMGKPTIKLTIFWYTGESIRMYLMFDHTGHQIVSDHYLVVAKFREIPAVNKQRSHRFHKEWFYLKN
jgi:hypothetical protein